MVLLVVAMAHWLLARILLFFGVTKAFAIDAEASVPIKHDIGVVILISEETRIAPTLQPYYNYL